MNISDTNGPALVLLGMGGHARSMLALLSACGQRIAGCIAPDAPSTDWPNACAWLGGEEALARLDPAKVALVNGLGSTRSTDLRQKVFETARARGFNFPVVVDPKAIIAEDAILDEGVQVLAGAILQSRVTVGKNTLLNTGCIVDHDCAIGSHAHLAPGVTLSGSVRVGSNVHIGTGAIVIQGVSIGDGALVGAGAVVLRDVMPGVKVIGNPARPL